MGRICPFLTEGFACFQQLNQSLVGRFPHFGGKAARYLPAGPRRGAPERARAAPVHPDFTVARRMRAPTGQKRAGGLESSDEPRVSGEAKWVDRL